MPMANVIAIGAGLPGAILAAWTFSVTRKDTRSKEERQAQADRTKELRAQEQSILDWTRGELTDARKQIAANEIAYRKQMIETEDERDRWESRARWWYGRAHDLLGQVREARHLLGNYEQVFASLIARGAVTDHGFEQLTDIRPTLPSRIEDIEGQT